MSEKSWKGVSNPEEEKESGTLGVPNSCPAPEEMEKRRKFIVIPVFVLVFLGVMY